MEAHRLTISTFSGTLGFSKVPSIKIVFFLFLVKLDHLLFFRKLKIIPGEGTGVAFKKQDDGSMQAVGTGLPSIAGYKIVKEIPI